MGGFETVVRPVVFPDIRPQRARSLPPQDDPTKGFAEIKGNGGQHIDLTYSMNASVQCSRPRETKRQVDVVRINQVRLDGSVNENNFVDVEVPHKIWTNEGSGPGTAPKTQEGDPVPTMQQLRERQRVSWYGRPKPVGDGSVTILQRDKIVRNDAGE